MPSPRPLASLVVLGLLLSGCAATEEAAVPPEPAFEQGDAADGIEAHEEQAYAAYARERAKGLKRQLRSILRLTLPTIRQVRDVLQGEVAAVRRPLVLASSERRLRSWHKTAVSSYRVQINELYDVAEGEIQALIVAARAEATTRAQSMAPPRAPLDAGPTGDPLLDRELVNFNEALEAAVSLSELSAQRQLDVLARVELYEYYNSFGEEGADEALGARLIVFVGGAELADQAQARVVLRPQSPEDLTDRRAFQAVRYRIMRGNTLVQDLGWRPMPGIDGWAPGESHDDRYLVWSGVQPGLRREAAGFEQLKDMRILADIQTAIVSGPEGAPEVLGGVDWRLEFRVTFRGAVAWQPSAEAVPAWNPDCDEVRRLIGTAESVADART